MGFCVLIFDYRGYGNSSGSPSERGTYLDVKGAWNFLVQRKKFQPAHIILFGRSLGGSIAAWLAKENNPGALIIESVFKSVPKIGQSIYPFLPVKLLSRFSYNTEEYIKQIKCPLLVIHSPDDEIIPFSHGADLYRIAGQPKSFLKIRGSHNEGFLLSSDQYIQGMQNFLSALK